MLVAGEWQVCEDGVTRPLFRGEVLASDGSWKRVDFLLDIGADRTVFNETTLGWLRVRDDPVETTLGGIGGTASSIEVATDIRLTTDQGVKIVFRGQYAAVSDSQGLDMSLLGRDITCLFAVIVDQPGKAVCMLSQRHRYHIESV